MTPDPSEASASEFSAPRSLRGSLTGLGTAATKRTRSDSRVSARLETLIAPRRSGWFQTWTSTLVPALRLPTLWVVRDSGSLGRTRGAPSSRRVGSVENADAVLPPGRNTDLR